jgi:uncharacterized protein (TIGR02246 family)
MSVYKRRQAMLMTAVLFLIIVAFVKTTPAQQKQAGAKQEASQAARLAEVRAAIDEGNAAAMRAWTKGDAALFVSSFADDGVELRPDGSVIKGREKILEFVKGSMKRLGPGVELTVRTTNVWLDGDTAYETGKSVYKYTEQGQPKTFETLFTTVWKKRRDGRWKIVADLPVRQD